MRDLHNNLLVKRAISSTRVTDNTAQVSQIIDRQGFESVEFVLNIGTVADADATIACLLEEGDNSALSDAGTVSATDTLGTQTAAGFQFDSDNQVRKIGYIGTKRYLRLTLTPANNTGNLDIGALALLFAANGLPVTQPTS
ncbi:hypothetical protein [Zavarzinella formosa]|uniref:hypothetical protein n=1 Tax=Zavarzinella formosa TaxID=360055 RepID=UPI0002F433C9|nr:hypothetical protein [Zavarzinella formosa]